MRVSTLLAPLCFAATGLAQAVQEGIAPASPPPDGCQTTVSGTFEIGTLENPTLRRRETAQEAADGALSCTLNNGILHDQYKRTGSVVANRQFQFDGPPQAGAIYTGGFSVCKNGSLAIGGSTRWWRCMSGNFGNLYDEWIGAQCHEIRIQAIFPASASTTVSSSIAASTVKASEVGPTASLSASASASASGSGSGLLGGSSVLTSSVSKGTSFPTASEFHFSASSTAKSAASGSASAASSTQAPPAPGAASSLYVARGATLLAALALLSAALVL